MPQNYEYWDDSNNAFQQQTSVQPQPPQGQQQPTASQQAQPQPVYRTQASTQQAYDLPPTWHPPAQEAERQAAAENYYQYQAPQPPYQAPQPVQPQQVAYVAVPQKKGRGWIVALVVLVIALIFAAFCIKSCADVMTSNTSIAAPAGNSIAVINIDGTIQYDGSACSPEGFKVLLDEAADNSNIKGVVLRVNSGGGTATAGEEMSAYLREFKEKTGKPVVVSSASLNASAAYEISSQADYIYVAKSTEIGAIGTAMEVRDISGLLDMLGVDVDVITSADSKDSSYGYRPLTDEEREYYQRMINQINDMFIENVATGRGMTIDEVRALATGLGFTGLDAIDNKLADEVGTLEDALDKTADLAGVSNWAQYDLSLSSYDLSSLAYLFGNNEGSGSRVISPFLKQYLAE